MGNRITIFVSILCFLLFTVFFSSCEKDSPTQPKRDMSLVGTWNVSLMSSESEGKTKTLTESQLDSIGLAWTLKFEEDGTAEQTTNISGELLVFPGNLSTSANKLTLQLTAPTGEVGTMIYEYSVVGNMLKLNWEMWSSTNFYAEFTKQ